MVFYIAGIKGQGIDPHILPSPGSNVSQCPPQKHLLCCMTIHCNTFLVLSMSSTTAAHLAHLLHLAGVAAASAVPFVAAAFPFPFAAPFTAPCFFGGFVSHVFRKQS